MKYELKEFQDKAVRDLLTRLGLARTGVAQNVPQAIILSSPTGSGKTVTLAAVLERIVQGDTGLEPNPSACFLWVSDSPELNAQSLDKVWRASDAFGLPKLVTIDAAFDQQRFTPGTLYFINTSKLGKEKLLTTRGDKREWTFWQTVANTCMENPDNFVLILDEAHRGMAQSAPERSRAKSIVQKFILGSESDGLPAPGVPIILGMSATPQRFDDLLAGTDRSKNTVKITVEDVRASGLLKDLILVHVPRDNTPGDLTLLEQAARRWHAFETQWADYCHSQNVPQAVRPVLVIQVEDGNPDKGILTKTNLNEVVQTIERVVGPLSGEDFAHCFQEDGPIEAAGKKIRKVEASRIQEEPYVRVVFFKMSLTTGWDCPRAEVMMSFRRAQDHTLIAQLIGRMIRTPLARRIEGGDVLNTVELFLPHYDSKNLDQIIHELKNPDAESGMGTDAASGADIAIYPRRPGADEAFTLVQSLPSYALGRFQEIPALKRLLRLGAQLTLGDDLDQNALDEARNTCIDILMSTRAKLGASGSGFAQRVQERGELEIETVGVTVGNMTAHPRQSVRVKLTPENVDDLFERCGRMLGAGEGIHKEFWRRLYDPEEPERAKLELYEILRTGETLMALEGAAVAAFDRIYTRNRAKIAKLPSSAQEPYNRLTGAGKGPTEVLRTMPFEITVRKDKDGVPLDKHLYADAEGDFHAKLNGWEMAVLDAERKDKAFVGWLRNIDRKEWSIAVPYEDRGLKPFYPDFVVVRQVGKELVADLIDPHNSKLDDTWAKVKGLAQFADRHGNQFGRLEIVIVDKGQIKRIDVNKPTVREKARRVQSNNDIDALFQ